MIKKLIKIWNKIKYKFKLGNTKKSKQLAKKIIKENNINHAYEISYFIQSKMKYVSDPLFGIIDTQQDLYYTKQIGWKGDCDDYALIAYRLAEQLGYKPFLLTLIRKDIRKNHVVCIFEKDNKIILIGTEGYQKFNNMNELLKKKNAVYYSKDKIK